MRKLISFSQSCVQESQVTVNLPVAGGFCLNDINDSSAQSVNQLSISLNKLVNTA